MPAMHQSKEKNDESLPGTSDPLTGRSTTGESIVWESGTLFHFW